MTKCKKGSVDRLKIKVKIFFSVQKKDSVKTLLKKAENNEIVNHKAEYPTNISELVKEEDKIIDHQISD